MALSKMKGRARRRMNLARMKAKARRIYPHDKKARSANHLATCSCYACGNPRRHFGELTMQERRARDRADQEMDSSAFMEI